MDWSRAKNILILAFLTLNLFLGYRLSQEISRYPVAAGSGQVSTEEIAEAKEHLLSLGLEVEVAIPRETATLPLLKVRLPTPNHRRMAQHLFNGLEEVQITRPSGSEGEILYFREGEEMRAYGNGILTYRNPHPSFNLPPGLPLKEAAQQWVEGFIAQQQEFGQELSMEEIRELLPEKKYFIRLQQAYQGRPLVGSAGVEILISASGLEFLWQRPLEPLEPAGEEKATIPATEALLRLAALHEGSSAGEPAPIVEITLGYYNKLYDAQEWEAVPAWAICTGGDHWHYINAFTGELEL